MKRIPGKRSMPGLPLSVNWISSCAFPCLDATTAPYSAQGNTLSRPIDRQYTHDIVQLYASMLAALRNRPILLEVSSNYDGFRLGCGTGPHFPPPATLRRRNGRPGSSRAGCRSPKGDSRRAPRLLRIVLIAGTVGCLRLRQKARLPTPERRLTLPVSRSIVIVPRRSALSGPSEPTAHASASYSPS
jgi:hypothetical protein